MKTQVQQLNLHIKTQYFIKYSTGTYLVSCVLCSIVEPQPPFYGYNRGKGAASALIYSNTYRYQAKGPITDFHTFLGAKIHTFMGVEDRGHGGCSLGRVGVGVKPVLKKEIKQCFILNNHVK